MYKLLMITTNDEWQNPIQKQYEFNSIPQLCDFMNYKLNQLSLVFGQTKFEELGLNQRIDLIRTFLNLNTSDAVEFLNKLK